MENKLNIKYTLVKDLIPSVYNPRKWDEKAIVDLTESIKKYGLVDPLLKIALLEENTGFSRHLSH
jgi:ParB-like chromosome segregation protein Spo0J